jgi:hypothetical protein
VQHILQRVARSMLSLQQQQQQHRRRQHRCQYLNFNSVSLLCSTARRTRAKTCLAPCKHQAYARCRGPITRSAPSVHAACALTVASIPSKNPTRFPLTAYSVAAALPCSRAALPCCPACPCPCPPACGQTPPGLDSSSSSSTGAYITVFTPDFTVGEMFSQPGPPEPKART